MATLYEFICRDCGYAAEVAGGTAILMSAVTTTITCATCRALKDVVISEEPWRKPDQRPSEHPKCSSSRSRAHRTALWTDPGPCPKCGAIMQRSGTMVLAD